MADGTAHYAEKVGDTQHMYIMKQEKSIPFLLLGVVVVTNPSLLCCKRKFLLRVSTLYVFLIFSGKINYNTCT